MDKCICGHTKNKHDFAIKENDDIGKHCLGKNCKCKKFASQEKGASK